MKRKNLSKLFAAAIAAALSYGRAPEAQAVPVNALFIEDPRCDVLPTQQLSHELGNLAFFPLNESITVNTGLTPTVVCVPDDLIVNDWRVQITNTSGIAWQNLFFVGNLGMTIGNSDGLVMDIVNAPGVVADAFRIDGTVTAGLNNNLIFESMTVNEIFEPGETWDFYVTNFMHPSGVTPPPLFNSPGLFGGSAPVNANFADTASIVANPVPEPGALGMLGLALSALFLRRPTAARH